MLRVRAVSFKYQGLDLLNQLYMAYVASHAGPKPQLLTYNPDGGGGSRRHHRSILLTALLSALVGVTAGYQKQPCLLVVEV
eukprot:1731454-Amphidinium_carterae.1